MNKKRVSRRQALARAGAMVAGTVAGSALAHGQTRNAPLRPAAAPHLAPREELVSVPEYEDEARKTLAKNTFSLIAGGDRAMMDRITLRPRMLVPTIDMDLSQTILGQVQFAPIMVAPISEQKRFHPDGELATAKGATAAKAVMIVSSQSSVPLDQIALQAQGFWYQVYASDAAATTQIAAGVKAGTKVVAITVGGAGGAVGAPINWGVVETLKQGVTVPVVIKGIATVGDATAALTHNVQGIIVSNHGGNNSPILDLPKIVDAVAGKLPVLVDGSFRRGTDILKALAFGAHGVIVGRPVMWGLAAYGDAGVQGVIEILQTELARYLGMCGKANLKALDRTVLKVHGLLPGKMMKVATTNA